MSKTGCAIVRGFGGRLTSPRFGEFLFAEIHLLCRQAPGSLFDCRAVIAEPVDQVLRLLAGYTRSHRQCLDCQTSVLAISRVS